MDLTEREKALSEVLKALHHLNVRINGIKVDACQCNLVAQVVLDVLKLDERRELAYRAGREDAARDIEAPDSPLCDCPRLENPPVNPISKAGMDHHCDCRAVVTAAAMLGGFEATKHVAQCICGRTWRTGSLPPVNQPRTLHQGETQTPTAGGEQ